MQEKSGQQEAYLEKALRYLAKMLDDPLALLTFLVLIVLIYHARLFRGTLRATEIAATAALDSANAARKSADALANTERAWVGAVSMAKVAVQENQSVVFSITIRNVGRTIARKVSQKSSSRFLPAGVPFAPDYPMPDPIPPHYGSSMAIFPGMKVTVRIESPVEMTQEIINELKNEKVILYVYGEITYEDVYERSHTSTYCAFVQPTLDRLSANPTYNDAD